MVSFVNLRLTAERLINENGRDISLIREGQGNPAVLAEPWRADDQTTKVTLVVKGVFVEFEKEDFDGTLVRRGDKRIFVAAKDTEDVQVGTDNIKIEDYDFILDGTVEWKIITVAAIEPGSLRVYYDIQVRQ